MRRLIAAVMIGGLAAAGLLVWGVRGDSPTIILTDAGFSPQVLTVPVHTTVAWHNDRGVNAIIAADDGTFNSGLLPPGGEFSFTFAAPGEFPYHDALGTAEGEVVVQPGVYRVFMPLVMKGAVQ